LVNEELQKEKDKLIFTQNELQKAYSDIENRVKERTNELHSTNQTLLEEIKERKIAEETARINEDYFRNIFEYSTVGKSITDIDGNLKTNNTFRQILGYTEEELNGYSWKKITHPDDIAYNQEMINSILAGEYDTRRWEKRYIHKDGHIVWVDISTVLQRDHDGNPHYFITTIQDINEQKKTVAALRQSEDRFRRAFQTNPDSITISQLDSGKYTSINSGFTQMLGYQEAEALGHTSLELNIWANRDERETFVNALRTKGVVENLETKFLARDGKIIDCLVSSVVIDIDGVPHILSTTKDITDRKRVENALRESEEKFRRLTENTPLPICYATENGTISYRNDRFVKVFGYTEVDVPTISEWWQKAYPDETYRKWVIQNWESAVAAASENDIDIRSDEYKVTCKDGTVRDVVISGISINGNLLVTLIDMTERKKAEMDLKISEERYRSLLINLEVGIVVHAPDTSIIRSNHRASVLLGLSEDQMLGKLPFDPNWRFIDENNISLKIEEYPVNKINSTRKPISDLIAGVIRPLTNDVVWLIVNGFPVFNNDGEITEIIVSFIDTTERKLAETALRESEYILYESQRASRIGSYVFDVKSELWKSSDVLDDIFGYEENSIHTLDRWTNAIHPDWREKIMDYFSNEVLNKHQKFDKEYQIVRQNDGKVLWVHELGELIFDSNNQPIKLIGTISDITERKNAEEENQKQLDELRRWYEVTLDRETRVLQLKQEVNELLQQSGNPIRYESTILENQDFE